MPRNRYHRLSFLADIRGIRSALGEMRGMGFPLQPRFSAGYGPREGPPAFDVLWFENTIKDKIATQLPGHRVSHVQEPLPGGGHQRGGP